MARKKETSLAQPLLIGTGIAAGVGALFLIRKALRPPIVIAAEGVEAVRTGAADAAQAVADIITGAKLAEEVVERTNIVVANAQALLAQTTDELEGLRLRLIQLEAAKAEAIALGQPFGLQPSIDLTRARIAELEALAS